MRDYFSQEQKDTIVDLYNKGHGQLYCAKAVGSTNVNQVKKVLKERGIHIRNFSEAAVKSNINRTLGKNQAYFKTQSHNMAWLLGFLASDGTVSSSDNTIKICLSAKDKEILERIKREVEIENKIVERTTKDGFDCADLHWTCAEHKKDLDGYGITPNKTFMLKAPTELSKEYYIDYIRGYFDGDGSVNLIHSHGKPVALRWQICGAQKNVLQWIIDVLYEQYGIPKVSIMETQRKHTLYYFQYSTSATQKIFEILYTPDSLYLERKYSHYKEIIQMI